MKRTKYSRLRMVGLGLLVSAAIAVGATAAIAASGPPAQKNVAPQVQAVPGSGKGIVIGYATSLEAVPIVHVISDGIRAQAKRAGAKLIFCDTGGDLVEGARLRQDDEDRRACRATCSSSTWRRHRRRSARRARRACR